MGTWDTLDRETGEVLAVDQAEEDMHHWATLGEGALLYRRSGYVHVNVSTGEVVW